jgi:hypothetical protein
VVADRAAAWAHQPAGGGGACIRPDPSPPSGRPLGKFLGKSLPSAERAATLKVLGLRALCEADAGTRTPDPFITSEVLYQLSYVGAGTDASEGARDGVVGRTPLDFSH